VRLRALCQVTSGDGFGDWGACVRSEMEAALRGVVGVCLPPPPPLLTAGNFRPPCLLLLPSAPYTSVPSLDAVHPFLACSLAPRPTVLALPCAPTPVACPVQLKGLVPASTRHDNDVVALAWLDIPTRLLVTGGSDGLVKVWR
jgi:hypothetical protein